MKENDIMVSVVCTAYNHERYIRRTFDGFVMQITNFKFEIIVHDDASTDNTACIIREYEKKHPDLIRAIYQTENQNSKGISVTDIALKQSRGKYIAYCEGDDFWIDAYKLQKQFDFMEAHPEYSLCVHAAYRVSADKEELLNDYHLRPNSGNKDYTVEEIIKGGGGIFATCSYFSRAKYEENMPDFYNNAPVGDYPYEIYMALKGKVYYIDEYMASYRISAVGSWTERVYSNINKRIAHFEKIADMLDQVNIYTNYKYNDAICWRKKCDRFNILLLQKNLKEFKKDEYREFYLKVSLRKKIKIHIEYYCPGLFNILRSIKHLLKRGTNER